MTAQEFWEAIDNYLTKQGLNRLGRLPPGVSEEELKAAESEMGVRLPRPFANFYRMHDGMAQWEFHRSDENDDVELVAARIGTLKEIVESWRFMCKIGREATENWGTPAEQNASPWEQSVEWTAPKSSDGFSARTYGVKSEHWHPGWIPFADNGCGDSVFLDLAADDGGHNGQIVDWWHENSMTRLGANNFADWLEAIADGLRDGTLTIVPGPNR